MFTFKISPDDGEPYVLKGDSRDIAKWEKTTKGASLHQLQENMRVVDLYKIAYNAAVRTGRDPGTLADFEADNALDTIEDEDDESQDPTRPAA